MKSNNFDFTTSTFESTLSIVNRFNSIIQTATTCPKSWVNFWAGVSNSESLGRRLYHWLHHCLWLMTQDIIYML